MAKINKTLALASLIIGSFVFTNSALAETTGANSEPVVRLPLLELGKLKNTQQKETTTTDENNRKYQALAECSAAIDNAWTNRNPVDYRDHAIVDTLPSLKKTHSTLFITGTKENPRLAAITPDGLVERDVEAVPAKGFDGNIISYSVKKDNRFHGTQANNENLTENIYLAPIRDFPYARPTFNVPSEHLLQFNLGMDQVFELNLNKTIKDTHKADALENLLRRRLRNTLYSHMYGMEDKILRRLGRMPPKYLFDNDKYDGRADSIADFKKAFCSCKDQSGFEGYQETFFRRIFETERSSDSTKGKFLLQENDGSIRPLSTGDLSCDLA